MQISLPYLDQPKPFWRDAAARYGDRLHAVYFPLPRAVFGSGRPVLPSRHLYDFLEVDDIPKDILLNAVRLDDSYERTVGRLWPFLETLIANYRIDCVTVQGVRLLADVKRSFPRLLRCTSTLMEISTLADLERVRGLADILVPSGWIVRDHRSLRALRDEFPGPLKLLVNEGCLVRCVWREDHFAQMNSAMAEPPTLCADALAERPWLRLTSGWILPQHLHLLDGLFDIAKIAGRGTIHTPDDWIAIADAYLEGARLTPDRIGVGPAGPLHPWHITTDYYRTTLDCNKACDSCSICSQEHERLCRDALGA